MTHIDTMEYCVVCTLTVVYILTVALQYYVTGYLNIKINS